MKPFKIIATIVVGYIVLFSVIVNYQSVINYFNRFPVVGFEKVLTKNSSILEKMEIDEISFTTSNYSGNAAGKEALSLTIYGTPPKDIIYLRGESIKLKGMKAVLDDGHWIVYGTEKIKEFDKKEIKSLFDARVTDFIELNKANYNNSISWTSQPKL